MKVHFVHLYGHGTVEHLSGERECCLVHVHCTYNYEVLRDANAVLVETFSHILVRSDGGSQVEIPLGIFLFQDGVGGNDTILTAFARLRHTQIFSKVLLHWCEVHLVEAKKVWSILVFPRLCHELQEVTSHKLRLSAHSAHIAYQLAGVMPVRFHLYHLKVHWLLCLVFFRVFFPTSTCQLSYDSTLACARDTCKKKERLRLNGGDVGAIFCIKFCFVYHTLAALFRIIIFIYIVTQY